MTYADQNQEAQTVGRPTAARVLRKWWLGAAALMMPLALLAQSPGKPYKIGFTNSQTGALGPGYLATEYSGFMSYVQALNAAGGVNGKKIEVEGLDDRSESTVAVTNYLKLANGDSIAAFGSAFSTMAVAQQPFVAEYGLPLIVGAVPDKLVRPPQPLFFSTNLSHGASAVLQVNFGAALMQKAGIAKPRVATFSTQSPGGVDFKATLERKFKELGWTVVEGQTHIPGTTDFSTQAAAIARAKPDVVMGVAIPSEMPSYLKALRQQGMMAPIVENYVGSEESVYLQMKDDNYYAPRSFVAPSADAATQMRADATAAGFARDMVSTAFTHGYVLGMLLKDVLVKCGADCDRKKFAAVVPTITNLDTKGLSGPAGFGASDHWLIKSAVFYKWDSATGKTIAVGNPIMLKGGEWMEGAK